MGDFWRTINNVKIVPESVKIAQRKEAERIENNRNSFMGQFFGNMTGWGSGYSIDPLKKNPNHPMKEAWEINRANMGALNKFMAGYMGFSITAPFIGTAMVNAPAAIGVSSDLTLKSFALKGGTSAVVQAIINQGDVNLAGVITDGTLGFGSSALISSGVNLNYSLKLNNVTLKTWGNGISNNQFLFNSSIGILFGAKSNYLGNQMKKTGMNESLIEGMTSPLYQFSSEGLGKAYEKEKK